MPRPATKKVPETVDLKKLNREWGSYPAPAEKERWVREYLTMTRHTQGRASDELITRRRPYEPKAVQKYRMANYRAITKSAMNRALNTLQRIMSKANVDVQWPEAADEFFNGKNFQDCDFMGYMNKFVIRRMIEDPNGLLVWWADLPDELNTRVQPVPILLLTSNIMHLSEDMLLFKADEKSTVTVWKENQRIEVQDGDVFYIITKAGYYKREQFGEKEKNRFRIVNGYAHQLGYLPYVVLGGEEMIDAKPGTNCDVQWFASYFEPCTQYADEALTQFSDWQGVMVTSAQPIREMETVKCPNSDCKKGEVIIVKRGVEKREDCPICKGKGEIVPEGPFGVIYRKSKRSGFAEAPGADPVPMIRHLHADPSILEQIEKAWRQLILDVEKALHLLFIEEAQSGVAKDIDREDKVSTLDRIGQNIFGVLVANSVEICLALLKIPGEVEITMPATFLVRTDEDLRKEITELSTGGITPLYRSRATRQLIRSRFPTDARLHKIMDVLAYYDRADGYTNEEKASMVASGAFSDVLVQKSNLAPAILQQISQDMEVDAFVKMPLKTIAQKLEAAITKELAANPVIAPPVPGEEDPNNPGDGGDGDTDPSVR